jgi:hypothetical protein
VHLRRIKEKPNQIYALQDQINECLTRINFYTSELSKLDEIRQNGALMDFNELVEDTLQEETEELLNFKEQNQAKLNELLVDLERLKENRQKLKKELVGLNSEKPFLVKTLSYVDKRVALFGKLAKSEKKFFYDNSNAPILKVEKTCPNGTFKEEVLQKEKGFYKVKYESDRGKDGSAKILIYIRERDRVENRTRAEDITETILPELEIEIEQYEKNRSMQENTIKEIEKSLRQLDNRSLSSFSTSSGNESKKGMFIYFY